MSGVGKWIKKHPTQSIGILAGLATGGAGLAGMGPLAGLLGTAEAAGAAGVAGGAAVPLAEGLGAGAAGEMLSSVPATFGDKAATFIGNATYGGGLDKIGPYAKLAGNAQGLLSPQAQQPMPQIQPPQLRGPGASLNPMPMYGNAGGMYGGDPEEERRRMMMAYWAQQGGM